MAYLAVLAPGILAVTTLLIWLSASHWPGWATSNGPMAFVTGVSLGIALWVFLSAALVRSSTVQNANPNVWRALCSELDRPGGLVRGAGGPAPGRPAPDHGG